MHSRIILHHTVTAPGTGRSIAAQKKYHIIVDRDAQGRYRAKFDSVPLHRRTTFAVGHLNTGSLSVAFVGDFTRDQAPAVDDIVSVLVPLARQYRIHWTNIFTHRQAGLNLVAPGKRYSTACAGKINDLIPAIRLGVAAQL